MDKEKFSIPAAIIVAGLIVGGALYASSMRGPATGTSSAKSTASQVGLDEKKLQACVTAGTYADKVKADATSGDRAMAQLPQDQRGTPYNVIYNTATKVTVSIPGAYPHDAFKTAIDTVIAGTAKDEHIALDPITATDHVFGDKNATIVIVEYGDLECPYCAALQPTLQQLITEYNGKVAWVYRNFPIHQNAPVLAQAAECAAVQGGDAAFFKYIDKIYSDMREQENPSFDTGTL